VLALFIVLALFLALFIVYAVTLPLLHSAVRKCDDVSSGVSSPGSPGWERIKLRGMR
jgi:hypothetical protein